MTVAVDLDLYAPYDSGLGANVMEDTWRKFARHWRGDGVIRDAGGEFRPYADSTGMQVKVPAGECWIRAQWGESDTEKTLPIAAADPTLGRRDLIVLRNDHVANKIVLDVLTGTPAASPVYPTVSQNTSIWEIQLGKVVVNPGVVTISAGDVTAVPEFVDAACRFLADSGLQNITSGTRTAVDWDTTQFPSSGVDRIGLSQFKLLRSGMWMVQANVVWSPNGTGERWLFLSRLGDEETNRLGLEVAQRAGSGVTVQNIVGFDRFAKDDIIVAYVFQNSGSTLQVQNSWGATACAFYWLGP